MSINAIDVQYDKYFKISFEEYLKTCGMGKESFDILQKNNAFEADKIRERYHATQLKST